MNENFVFVRFFRLTAVVCFIAALGACNTNETRPEGASSGAEAKTAVVRHGYACCNLHYSGDWISDSNLAELPFIAVGTPIGVKKIDGNRASWLAPVLIVLIKRRWSSGLTSWFCSKTRS